MCSNYITKNLLDNPLTNCNNYVLNDNAKGVYIVLLYNEYHGEYFLKVGETTKFTKRLKSLFTQYKLSDYIIINGYEIPQMIPLCFIITHEREDLERIILKKLEYNDCKMNVTNNMKSRMTELSMPNQKSYSTIRDLIHNKNLLCYNKINISINDIYYSPFELDNDNLIHDFDTNFTVNINQLESTNESELSDSSDSSDSYDSDYQSNKYKKSRYEN